MLRAVADTHAVIWYIFGDARLSTTARDAIAQIAAAGEQVAFSSITLAEIISDRLKLCPFCQYSKE